MTSKKPVVLPKSPESLAEVAGPELITNLREAVHPPGKKGTWLRLLNDNQLLQVYYRLKSGTAPFSVAKMVKHEWGLRKNSDVRSMTRAIAAFKKNVVGEIQAMKSDPAVTYKEADKISSRGERISKKLDGLAELVWLAEQQKERIMDLRKKEKTSMPFQFTVKEMQAYKDIVDTYLEWCKKLGIIDHKPPEMNVNFKHQFEGVVKGVIGSDKPKVIEATEKLAKMWSTGAQVLEKGEDGAYHLTEGD